MTMAARQHPRRVIVPVHKSGDSGFRDGIPQRLESGAARRVDAGYREDAVRRILEQRAGGR